jgi:hypothetical protein
MLRYIGPALALFFAWHSAARADDLTILVAPKGTDAQANADKLADGTKVIAETKLYKAFDKASEHLVACKTCVVTIKVASGVHTAKAKGSTWTFPDTVAPTATLRILGGYDAKFKDRAPLTTPSILATTETRSAPVLQFEGKKHAFKEILFSGFLIDVSPGNKYDQKSNMLLKGTSSTWPMLSFGYVTVEKLIIADNTFMNAAHAVGGPLIRPANESSEVIVRNNLFVNNVFCWTAKSAAGKIPVKRYLFEGNSFILNWPYNPDTTTSNPGTLEIGDKYTASLIEIRGNLWAYNIGGAIFPGYDDKVGPKIAIKDNLFWENGALFQPDSPGEGAVIGKFNRSATYAIYDPETVEDDFSWDSSGNIVLDPKLGIPELKIKALGQKPDATTATTASGGGGDETKLEDFFDDTSEIEIDTSVEGEDYADDGKIKNYAPRFPLNVETLPFPKEAKAKKYGADPTRVVTP